MIWLLEIANENEYGPAQYLIGQCYYQGLNGFPCNFEMARYYLHRADQPKQIEQDQAIAFQWEILQ